MDFALTEEQVAVRDLSRTILAQRSTPEHLAALERAGDWLDRDTWLALADAGLLAAPLPTDHGGAGLGFLGAHLLLEEVGATAAKLPVLETLVLGALALAELGPAELAGSLIPGIVAGEVITAPALADDGLADPRLPSTSAERDADHWVLQGRKALVALAPVADVLLVSARTHLGPPAIFVVDARTAGVDLAPQQVIGDVPYADVHLADVRVPAGNVLGSVEHGPAVLDWILRHGAAGVASQQAGICTAAVRLAADHTSRREQFGRPVATFQAVSQRVADAHIDAEGVRLTALEAAWRLTEGLPAAEAVAIAKWWSAEAGHRVLHAAHHVHGGIGVDRDYPLFRYTLRTKQLEHTFGAAPGHLGELGADLAATSV